MSSLRSNNNVPSHMFAWNKMIGHQFKLSVFYLFQAIKLSEIKNTWLSKRYKCSSIIKITVTKVQNICTEPTFSRSKFPSQTMLTEETPGSWLWSWELWPSWCSADKEGQTLLLVSRITALGFYIIILYVEKQQHFVNSGLYWMARAIKQILRQICYRN